MAGLVLINFFIIDQTVASQAAKEKPMKVLGLEDPAPTLDSAILIKGKEIPQFSADRIYVLDLWATNCAPCVKGLPHIRALAEKYGDRVTVVSINVEKILNPKISRSAELERVKKFVKDRDDLMNYTVIMDDERGTLAARWHAASGSYGLPAGFIIANNKIAWMGMPSENALSTFDSTLAAIVAGTDPNQRLQVLQAIQVSEDAQELRRLATWPTLVEAKRTQTYPLLAQIYEQAIATNPRLEIRLSPELFSFMLHTEPTRAYSYAREALDRFVAGDDKRRVRAFFLLNFVEYMIRDGVAERITKNGIDAPNLDIAQKWIQESIEITPQKWSAQYIYLAKIHFMRGEAEQAVQTQERAIAILNQEFADDPETRAGSIGGMESTLTRYRAALDSKPVKSGQ